MLAQQSRMENHRSWSVVSAVSLTIFTVVVFGLLAAVIVWSSKANGRCIVADGRSDARIPRLTAPRLGLMYSPSSQRRQEAAVHRTIAVCLIALTACAVAVPTAARNTNGRWNYLAADMRGVVQGPSCAAKRHCVL